MNQLFPNSCPRRTKWNTRSVSS